MNATTPIPSAVMIDHGPVVWLTGSSQSEPHHEIELGIRRWVVSPTGSDHEQAAADGHPLYPVRQVEAGRGFMRIEPTPVWRGQGLVAPARKGCGGSDAQGCTLRTGPWAQRPIDIHDAAVEGGQRQRCAATIGFALRTDRSLSLFIPASPPAATPNQMSLLHQRP